MLRAEGSTSRAVHCIACLVAIAAWALASPPAARAQAGELESMFVTPASPTTADAVVLHALTVCSNPFSGGPLVLGQTITLDTTYFGLYPPCAAGLPPYEVSFSLGTLPAGTYTVDVVGNGGVPDGTVVFTFPFQVASSGEAAAVNPQLDVTPTSPTDHDSVLVQAQIDGDPTLHGAYPQLVLARNGNEFDISTVGIILSPLPPGPYRSTFHLGPLTPGLYRVVLTAGGQRTVSSFVVSEPATGLTLQGARFQVKVVRGPGGDPVPAVQVSDESGYFWFFDSSNMELTVKLLDGRAVNGHYWLFAASMTDQPFVLEVIDTRDACTGASCVKTYAGTAGQNKNVIDLAVFQ